MTSSKAVDHAKIYNSEHFCKIIEQYDSVTKFEQFIRALGVDCSLCIEQLNGKRVICFDFAKNKIDFFTAASTGTIAFSYLYLDLFS